MIKKQNGMKIILLTCIIVTSSLAYDVQELVEGNNAFALDLYSELKDQEGNLFLSPYSISTAMAMVYAGARGNTETQIADVFHFLPDQEVVHNTFSNLQADIMSIQNDSLELSIANALWLQTGYTFLDTYLDLVNTSYDAGLHQVDFERNCEAARMKINKWVEDKTKKKIKDLIKPGIVDDLTRLVLTNAIYFYGAWENPFDDKETHDDYFFCTLDDSIKIPMMFQTGSYRYADTMGVQILELPYKDKTASMVILLPKKPQTLIKFEPELKIEKLDAMLRCLKDTRVTIHLPRFTMTSEFELARTLVDMGMPDAFDVSVADFSGMTGKKRLSITDVVHKAFVDVSEQGTEAAAATAVILYEESIEIPMPQIIFRADQPFLFLIRDDTTGSILFIGRVVDPSG